MFKTGYIPDLPDSRDKDASELLGVDYIDRHDSVDVAVTGWSDLNKLVIDVLNQANLGSCVANAGAQAVRMSQLRQLLYPAAKDMTASKRRDILDNPPPLSSRLLGYLNSRAYHGAVDVDEGTHIRYFFKALNKYGFCPESLWAYDTSRFAEVPRHRVYQMAFDQRGPTEYYRITEIGEARIGRIVQAITNGHPVVFGTDVSEAFCRNEDVTGFIPIPEGPIAGGHAMVAMGHNADGILVLNSWGAGFGCDGRAWFSNEYMAWESTRDLWVVVSAPSYSQHWEL